MIKEQEKVETNESSASSPPDGTKLLRDKLVLVRSNALKKRNGKLRVKPVKPAKEPKAAKAAKAPAKAAFGAKAAFIRSMPDSMSAQDVVKEAAKAGLKLTAGRVYNQRYIDRELSQQPKKKPRAKYIVEKPKADAAGDKVRLWIGASDGADVATRGGTDQAHVGELLKQIIDSRIRLFFAAIAAASEESRR